METYLNNPEHAELLKFLLPKLDFSAQREMYERFLFKSSKEREAELLKKENTIIHRLFEDGITAPMDFLTGLQVDEITNYFKGKQCLPYHVSTPNQTKGEMSLSEALDSSNFATYPITDIINAPYLLKIATSKEFLDVANKYLCPNPLLYSIGLFWAGSGANINPINQAFHRDYDDFKFLSLFVYLTDIDNYDDGPHIYLKKTHSPERIEEYFNTLNYSKLDRVLLGITSYIYGITSGYKYLGYGNSFFPKVTLAEFNDSHKLHPAYEKIMKDLAVKIFAKRGKGFYADVGGFHKGVIPKSKPRLIFWARFGVSDGYTNFQNMGEVNFKSLGVNKEELDPDAYRLLLQT